MNAITSATISFDAKPEFKQGDDVKTYGRITLNGKTFEGVKIDDSTYAKVKFIEDTGKYDVTLFTLEGSGKDLSAYDVTVDGGTVSKITKDGNEIEATGTQLKKLSSSDGFMKFDADFATKFPAEVPTQDHSTTSRVGNDSSPSHSVPTSNGTPSSITVTGGLPRPEHYDIEDELEEKAVALRDDYRKMPSQNVSAQLRGVLDYHKWNTDHAINHHKSGLSNPDRGYTVLEINIYTLACCEEEIMSRKEESGLEELRGLKDSYDETIKKIAKNLGKDQFEQLLEVALGDECPNSYRRMLALGNEALETMTQTSSEIGLSKLTPDDDQYYQDLSNQELNTKFDEAIQKLFIGRLLRPGSLIETHNAGSKNKNGFTELESELRKLICCGIETIEREDKSGFTVPEGLFEETIQNIAKGLNNKDQFKQLLIRTVGYGDYSGCFDQLLALGNEAIDAAGPVSSIRENTTKNLEEMEVVTESYSSKSEEVNAIRENARNQLRGMTYTQRADYMEKVIDTIDHGIYDKKGMQFIEKHRKSEQHFDGSHCTALEYYLITLTTITDEIDKLKLKSTDPQPTGIKFLAEQHNIEVAKKKIEKLKEYGDNDDSFDDDDLFDDDGVSLGVKDIIESLNDKTNGLTGDEFNALMGLIGDTTELGTKMKEIRDAT